MIEVNFTNESRTFSLKADTPDEFTIHIIQRAFKEVFSNTATLASLPAPETKEETKQETVEVAQQKDNQEQESKTDTLTLSPPSAPDFYTTGIKIVEATGLRLYKAWYKCPNCENTGKHYVPKDTKICNCHNCGFELKLENATPQPFGERDQFGNFYVARKLG